MNPQYDPQQQQQSQPMYTNNATATTPLLQQGMPPMTHVAVPMQQTVILSNVFRESPVACACPYCHSQIVTATTYASGTATYLAAGLVFMFGGVCGCCLIPFYLDGCKDVEHACPACNRVVGVYRRI